MTKGTLAILGSGETAPGMTKVHRELLKRHASELRAVTLDTAYGFQENVPQMTEKLVTYFDTSLHVKFTPLHFTSYERASEIDRAVFKQQVRESNYVFAGPGSPSYAVQQWLPLHLSDDFNTVLQNGGTLCRDVVRYAVPFDFIAHPLFVRREVKAIFDFRAEALKSHFANRA